MLVSIPHQRRKSASGHDSTPSNIKEPKYLGIEFSSKADVTIFIKSYEQVRREESEFIFTQKDLFNERISTSQPEDCEASGSIPWDSKMKK
jgi:hypothetical protein